MAELTGEAESAGCVGRVVKEASGRLQNMSSGDAELTVEDATHLCKLCLEKPANDKRVVDWLQKLGGRLVANALAILGKNLVSLAPFTGKLDGQEPPGRLYEDMSPQESDATDFEALAKLSQAALRHWVPLMEHGARVEWPAEVAGSVRVHTACCASRIFEATSAIAGLRACKEAGANKKCAELLAQKWTAALDAYSRARQTVASLRGGLVSRLQTILEASHGLAEEAVKSVLEGHDRDCCQSERGGGVFQDNRLRPVCHCHAGGAQRRHADRGAAVVV